jgi:hypothetical protein
MSLIESTIETPHATPPLPYYLSHVASVVTL